MTENEAVEIAMARSMHDAARQRFGRCWEDLNDEECAAWRRAARLALTSHPAVEVLLALYVAADAVWLDDETTTADEHTAYVSALEDARAVLASMPKEK